MQRVVNSEGHNMTKLPIILRAKSKKMNDTMCLKLDLSKPWYRLLLSRYEARM